jgi:hypothetical protein
MYFIVHISNLQTTHIKNGRHKTAHKTSKGRQNNDIDTKSVLD